MELPVGVRNKDKLAGRKEKQNFQLFIFSGKAKNGDCHFNIISPKERYLPL